MRKPRPYKETHYCECGECTEIIVHPYIPAITSHCYEDNEEADGGYCDPDECKCGAGIDYEDYE
jgi:hypothetical protein